MGLPEILFSETLPYTIEAGGYVTFNLELSEPVSAPVTVYYRTVTGTADDASVDFDAAYAGTTFSPGLLTAFVSVFVRADFLAEPDEFYFVELFNPVGATFGGRNHSLRAAAWINDNDAGGGAPAIAVTAPVVLEGRGSAVFTVSLSEAAGSDTVVTYRTVADTARAGSDFTARAGTLTIDAGETSGTVEVPLKNGRQQETVESFGLAVEASGGRRAFGRAELLDDDGRLPTLSVERVGRVESGGYVDVILRLSEAAPAPVTVDARTVDGTADGFGVDYDTILSHITIAAGEYTTRQSVFIREDALGEADESWFLELFNPVGARFGGLNHSLRRASWIFDEDAGGGQRGLDVAAPVVVEGKGEAVFTVSLSEAFASTTTLRYATVAGSAGAGRDFKADKGRLTFYAGQTEASVAIALKNDRAQEAGESFGLKVTGPGGLAGYGAATLLDDDGRRSLSVEGLESLERGGYRNVALRLSEASSAPVTVDLRTIDGSARSGSVDYDARSATVTFEPGEMTATERIFLRADASVESDEFFYVELSNPVGARFGPGDLAPRAVVWIRDDDPGTQKRALAVSDIKVAEDAGHANVTISLSRPLEDDLVIRFKTENGSARAGKDFVKESGRITVAAGATEAVVPIKLIDDRAGEVQETFRLKLTDFDRRDFAPSGHDTLATARIVDDDGRGPLSWDADSLI